MNESSWVWRNNLIRNPNGDFREASRVSAALIGVTRDGGAVSGIIQEKAA